MALVFPNMTASTQADAQQTEQSLALTARPSLLPSLRARTQLATCASMTKSFLSKAFPSPQLPRWRLQTGSPTSVGDPTEASATSEATSEPEGEAVEAARGDICELIVVAVQRVTLSQQRDSSKAASGATLKRWGSLKRTQQTQPLVRRMACSVRSGAVAKDSAESTPTLEDEFVFDEKFVFARRQHDEQYHDVTIDVYSVPRGGGKKHRLGYVTLDLDAAFSRTASPIHRRSVVETHGDGDTEVHYVLHRLEVKSAAAVSASRVLTRASSSLNDDDDMDAFGQIFPDLWYLC